MIHLNSVTSQSPCENDYYYEERADIGILPVKISDPFLRAARCGNIKWIQNYINEGGDTSVEVEGNNALHFASFYRQTKVIDLLIKHLSPNSRNELGITPLHMSAHKGHVLGVCRLIKGGALVNDPEEEGETPLHLAAEIGHLGLIRLLAKKIPLETRDEEGKTPFHFAAASGKLTAVSYFVEKGCDINSCDAFGETPLHTAVHNSSEEVVRYLITEGADISAKDNEGNLPFHHAARGGYREVANLVFKEEYLNAQNSDGDTSLHIAAGLGYLSFVDFLLEKNAKPDLRNKKGETPLQVVLNNLKTNSTLPNNTPEEVEEKISIIKKLIAAGANDITSDEDLFVLEEMERKVKKMKQEINLLAPSDFFNLLLKLKGDPEQYAELKAGLKS